MRNFLGPQYFSNETNSKVQITLELIEDEKSYLGIESSETKAVFFVENNRPDIAIEGAISEYFLLEEYLNLVEFFENELSFLRQGMSQDQINFAKNLVSQLKNAHEILFRIENIKLVKDNLLSYMKAEIKEDFVEKCSQLQIFFDKLFDLLPIFAMYKENSLINRYVLDNNYKAKLSNEYISLQRLLQAAKLDTQDLDNSVKTGTELSLYAKSKINNNIINNIEIPFNKFYSQEEINIEIDVNSNVLGIVIKSGENGVINVFSERSQGLRWYLNFFIWIVANNLQNKNVFYLVDEPGISLHVEAQRELLKLFTDDLSKTGQIIYATHSPYMINTDLIMSICVVQKTKGMTEIINSPYSDKLDKNSKLETLSPLLNALGMRITDKQIIDDKKINVISEGVSDAIYLKGMANYLEYESFNFIPSSGADKEKFVASILWGWGLKFVCLFDNDKAGLSASKTVQKEYLGSK